MDITCLDSVFKQVNSLVAIEINLNCDPENIPFLRYLDLNLEQKFDPVRAKSIKNFSEI